MVDLGWIYKSTISKRSDNQQLRFKEGGGTPTWPDMLALTIGGFILSCPGVFFAYNSGTEKITQPDLVTFLKIYWNLFRSEILSINPLLLPK